MIYPKVAVYDPKSVIKCYSLDLIHPFWRGNATCRIRRSSDNAQIDCYANSQGIFDKNFALNFASGSTLYVVTMYDQTGSGNNIAQATAANQPQLVLTSADNINRIVYSYASNTELISSAASIIDWTASDWTISIVAELTVYYATYCGIFTNRYPGNPSQWVTLGHCVIGNASPGAITVEKYPGTLMTCNQLPYTTNERGACFHPYGKGLRNYTLVKDTSAGYVYLYINSVLAGSMAITNCGDLTHNIKIGNWFGNPQSWDGHISDIMIFNKALRPGEI